MAATIDIVMSVLNGEAFLVELLDSILAQSCSDWRLLIRDDGSRDRSPDLVRACAARHEGRIVLVEDSDETLGARASFGRLLALSTAPYTMFCDQDDVWLPEKVEVTLAKMRELEARYGPATPLLTHTDLKVVDRSLGVIAESFWAYQYSPPENAQDLRRLLVQNGVTGCTTMINLPLRGLALPIPDGAVMHDWWCALVAASFGHIGHVPGATVLYRQHGANDTGAKPYEPLTLRRALGRALVPLAVLRDLGAAIPRKHADLLMKERQAAALAMRFSHATCNRHIRTAMAFAGIDRLGPIARRLAILRHGIFETGLRRNLSVLLSI